MLQMHQFKKSEFFNRAYVLLSRAPHAIAVKQVKMLFSLAYLQTVILLIYSGKEHNILYFTLSIIVAIIVHNVLSFTYIFNLLYHNAW